MLVKTTFFTGLDQIELSPTSMRGERFAKVYYITTDRRRIAEIVNPFAGSLGSVEVNYLTGQAAGLIYRIGDQEVEKVNPAASLSELLIHDMLSVAFLQFALWIIKDNAGHYDRAWIAARFGGRTIVNNNVWESRQSCSDGTYRPIRFETEELRAARVDARPPVLHIHSAETPTMLTSGSLRFQRFQYFLGSARATPDLAMKIAQYCSALEALVSTAQTELAHQVSERVAVAQLSPHSA